MSLSRLPTLLGSISLVKPLGLRPTAVELCTRRSGPMEHYLIPVGRANRLFEAALIVQALSGFLANAHSPAAKSLVRWLRVRPVVRCTVEAWITLHRVHGLRKSASPAPWACRLERCLQPARVPLGAVRPIVSSCVEPCLWPPSSAPASSPHPVHQCRHQPHRCRVLLRPHQRRRARHLRPARARRH